MLVAYLEKSLSEGDRSKIDRAVLEYHGTEDVSYILAILVNSIDDLTIKHAMYAGMKYGELDAAEIKCDQKNNLLQWQNLN